MASIRELARCIGLSGDISILWNFYGYTRVPLPQGRQLSLSTQARLLKGSHIHLNLIRVGTNENGWFSDADEEKIDAAVQTMRDVYGSVNIGAGRVERYFIPRGETNGLDIIDNQGEAKDLFDEWSVDNDGIDVFFVRFYIGPTLGSSATDAPCDKEAKSVSGVVVEIANSEMEVGFALAHELGHHLGLDQDFPGNHNPDRNNLMFSRFPNGGQLTGGQGGVMRLHCWMRSACQA